MCSTLTLNPSRSLCRSANNLNQAAIHANSYGGLYPDELTRLQKDYADLWGPLSDLLAQLSAIVTM